MAEFIQIKNRETQEVQYPKTSTEAVSHNGAPLTSVLDAKQNKLVAGANITINEETNTISATGGGSSTPIVTSFPASTLDTNVPSTKLVKSSLDTLAGEIDNKQNTLVAGTNVVISGNTISVPSGGKGEKGEKGDKGDKGDKGEEVLITIVAQTDSSVTLANNKQFDYATSPSEIDISLPSDWTKAFLSLITFESGSTATQVSFPDGLEVKGILEPNKKVEISIYNNNAVILNV